MMEIEDFGSAFPNQYPFVSDSGPVVEYLVPLDKFSTVRQYFGCGRLQILGQTFFPHYVDQADTTRPEARKDVAKNLYVFIFVVEIAKRCEHAENEVEGVRASKVAHIGQGVSVFRFHLSLLTT